MPRLSSMVASSQHLFGRIVRGVTSLSLLKTFLREGQRSWLGSNGSQSEADGIGCSLLRPAREFLSRKRSACHEKGKMLLSVAKCHQLYAGQLLVDLSLPIIASGDASLTSSSFLAESIAQH